MPTIRAFAPASVANVACGFDIMGFPLPGIGDSVEAKFCDGEEVMITAIEGDGGRLPLAAAENTAGRAAMAVLEKAGLRRGMALKLIKGIPLRSGIGSSAASAVAGACAANALLGSPLGRMGLLEAAIEGERVACGALHADNVAPSLFGNFTIVRSYQPLEVLELPLPAIDCVVVHPDLEVNTREARGILKADVPLSDLIRQSGNLAGLVVGLHRGDYDLIGRSLQDVIIEPQRAGLIIGFAEVKSAALAAGALGCSIAGSGPSLFAWCRPDGAAEAVGVAMAAAFARQGVTSQIHRAALHTAGPEISRHDD
jgi:homoserine kinase